jgi:hypothetical protein
MKLEIDANSFVTIVVVLSLFGAVFSVSSCSMYSDYVKSQMNPKIEKSI